MRHHNLSEARQNSLQDAGSQITNSSNFGCMACFPMVIYTSVTNRMCCHVQNMTLPPRSGPVESAIPLNTLSHYPREDSELLLDACIGKRKTCEMQVSCQESFFPVQTDRHNSIHENKMREGNAVWQCERFAGSNKVTQRSQSSSSVVEDSSTWAEMLHRGDVDPKGAKAASAFDNSLKCRWPESPLILG